MATHDGTPKKSTPIKKPTTKKAPTKAKAVDTARAIADTEKAMDSTVEKVTKKAASHISPETREKAQQFAHQADSLATEVEKFGGSVGSVADSFLPSGSGKEGVFKATYEHQVSRLFIFRCLWLLLQGPILAVRSIWYTIVSVVHYISMFITGKRTKSLREKQARFRRHVISRKSYMNALTDKRPAILVD